MCGICATIKKSQITDDDVRLIERMNDVQAHRGPDDSGIYCSTGFVFGHRRLSIIDLSKAGHQPMEFGGRYVITYNGEIYNYSEIKEELIGKGYDFCTSTDTEVIMAAFDCWREECVNHFNGMWAFIIYDNVEDVFFVSRDRFGVKPLYYHANDDRIILASEIKAILQDGSIERIANDDIVYDYLTQGLVDHTNKTFFCGISQFPKGEFAYIKRNLVMQPQKYWNLSFNREVEGVVSGDDILNFRESFLSAVKLRLRSDVSVGSCLSGGLDSSAIVCGIDSMREKRDGNARQYTFSYRADDKSIDEYEYMKAVIDETHVSPKFVTPGFDDLMKELDDLIYTQEEPFSTTGMYAGYCVYREAKRNGVKVLLDGQGADELLCGYRKSRIYYLKRLIKEGSWFMAIRELLGAIDQVKSSMAIKSGIKSDFNKFKRILFNKSKVNNIPLCYFKTEFIKNASGVGYDTREDFQRNDVFKISLPALLRYTDRNSMAFSVESRLPFLDPSFSEKCASLPLGKKIKDGYSKYIMRLALRLPQKVKWRRDKIGFATPEDKWICQAGEHIKKIFADCEYRSERYINREKIIERWDAIINRNEIPYFFRIICLEKWMRIYDVH